MRTARLLVPLACTLWLIAAPRAHACSPRRCVSASLVAPSVGASDVPLNMELVAQVEPGRRIVVVRSEAPDVIVRAIPRATGDGPLDDLLEPDTEYVVLRDPGGDCEPTSGSPGDAGVASDGGVGEPGGGHPPLADWDVIATFRTGSAEDHDPPVFSGEVRWGSCSTDSCDESACCGPWSHSRRPVSWPAASDASPVVYFVGAERLYETSTVVIVGDDADGHHAPPVAITAVDASGNRTQLLLPDVEWCTTGRDDGGTGGCSVAFGSDRSASAATLAVLVLAALGLRRARVRY